MKPDFHKIGRHNRQSGFWAELAARLYFRLHGWKIVAKNYKIGRATGAGEVDFIATKHKILAFVEVKKRQSLEDAAYAVSSAQKRRLIRAAAVFAACHQEYRTFDIRFDAVLICPPLKIKHICSAWEA
jgi:putative endonuclease